MGKHKIFAIIETPKGSKEKFDYDPKRRCFLLKKILPAGMVFPFDFGFIPDTKGQDGDPLDALLICNINTFPGCMIECAVLGAIKAEQLERDGKVVRNDRYLLVPAVTGAERAGLDMDTLHKGMIKEIEDFFINYNRQDGKTFRPLGYLTGTEAEKEIKKNKL